MSAAGSREFAADGPIQAVFDCLDFLQAFLGSSGPAFACLELVEKGRITLFLSREVLAEVADVLSRPSISRGRPSVTPERIEAFLDYLVRRTHFIENVPSVFTYPRDPKDEPYLNLAIAVQAVFLVSRDRDLLDLMDSDSGERRAPQRRFPSLHILDLVAFLKVISPQLDQGAMTTCRGAPVPNCR